MIRHRRGAFTLIELLVVILIIAVVSAVIVPAYGGYYAKTRFDGEVKRIQDYIAIARERAVAGDTTAVLHFERTADLFTITVDSIPPQTDLPTNMLNTPGTDLGPSQDVAPYHVNDEFRVESFNSQSASNPGSGGGSGSDLQFRGDGTCDGAEMTLISRYGYGVQLTVSASNGRVTIGSSAGR